MEDVQDYATSEDFPGQTADVTWMNQQLFNVLAQNTRGTPFQTVKTCQKKKVVAVLELGSNSCVLTWARIQAGVKDSPSESMTSSARRRTRVLARMEMWRAALKEHVKDTGCEVADITMANCLRRLVPTDLSADQQKMSHMVRCSDVKKNIIGQVGLRLCNDRKRSKCDPNCVKPMDTSLAEHSNEEDSGETCGNDESDLHAVKGKGTGFKEQCFHCGSVRTSCG